jgi:hypothetical protein
MAADGLRLVFLVMRAELDGLICSGSRRGKQFTYALVDERVPPATPIDRDEALAMLARRYFVSHGPATLRDYVWWSGLTVRDAKAGIELAKPALVREDSAGLTYWSTGGRVPASSKSPAAYLLPNYDEYLIAYKDRATVVGPSAADGVRRLRDAFVHHLVYDGRLAGSWTRTLNGGTVAVELATYARTTDATKRAVAAAVGRLSKFLGARAISSWADRT